MPMGPMMGGWGGAAWDPTVFVLLLAVVLVAGAGIVALVLWQDRSLPGHRSSPEEALRDRYSRGELSREQYRQALVDILKGRYVRGELDVERYEADLERLLAEPRAEARVADGGTARG